MKNQAISGTQRLKVTEHVISGTPAIGRRCNFGDWCLVILFQINFSLTPPVSWGVFAEVLKASLSYIFVLIHEGRRLDPLQDQRVIQIINIFFEV